MDRSNAPDHKGRKALVVQRYIDEEGNLRRRLGVEQTVFTDELKAAFLEEMAEHGRLQTACAAVGISQTTVRKHREIDEVFAELYAEALDTYRDRLVGHHQDLVFNGTTRRSYDRNGNVVSEEQIYPIRLIELELKKVDPAYRDKQEIGVNVTGGVFLAPANHTIEDWESKFGQQEGKDEDLVEDAEIVSDNSGLLQED